MQRSLKAKKVICLPQLSISQSSDQQKLQNIDKNEEVQDNHRKLKEGRIHSTKNLHEMKRFNFSETGVMKIRNQKKQQKITKLKKEKEKLIESLQILKNGAVSAIIQKDEMIQKFKKLFEKKQSGETDEETQSAADDVNKLQNLLNYIKELQDDKQYFQRQLQMDKNLFEKEIFDRDQVIQELTEQLNWSVQKISNLEKYGELLTEKIKVVEAQNQNLSFMLNRSQQTLKMSYLEKSRGDQKNFEETGQNSFNNSRNQDILPINLSSSIQCLHSLDQSVIENKLRQMKTQHEEQIFQITQFYEGQIETLKKVCERQCAESNRKIKLHDLEHSQIQNRSAGSSSTLKIRDRSMGNLEKSLRKNYSFGSLKSGKMMETIYQRQETVQRKNLKKDILGYGYGRDLAPNSEDGERSDSNVFSQKRKNFDNMSQFSSKYFQYQKGNFKKYKSEASVESNNEEEGKSKSGGSKWGSLMWFTLGTLAGGSLLSITHKIFNK